MALGGTTLAAVGETDPAKLDERLNSAQAVIQEIMATPDRAIPRHHREPRSQAATLGDEPAGLSPNLQQHFLHYILREIWFAQNSQ